MGGCDSDVRAFELAPQRFPGSLRQSRYLRRTGYGNRAPPAAGAFHSIAEKYRAFFARRDDEAIVAKRVAQVYGALSTRRYGLHVPVQRVEPAGFGQDLHDLPAPVVGIGAGHEAPASRRHAIARRRHSGKYGAPSTTSQPMWSM